MGYRNCALGLDSRLIRGRDGMLSLLLVSLTIQAPLLSRATELYIERGFGVRLDPFQ